MIRKIILLLILIVIFAAPSALANDSGPDNDNGGRLSFSFTLASNEVKIGEAFEFTIKITNKTLRNIQLISADYVFDGTYDGITDQIEDIVIKPYQTTELKISYNVPASLNWYTENGKYYVDFYPQLFYTAEAVLSTNLLDDTDAPDSMYNYSEYYQSAKSKVKCQITNTRRQ